MKATAPLPIAKSNIGAGSTAARRNFFNRNVKFRDNESIFGSNDESKRKFRTLDGIKRVKFGT